MSTKADDILYRQTNLTFALLGSNRPRSREWIRTHVDGYQNVTEKTLQRDIQFLRGIGVPVSVTHDEIAIEQDDYELPSVTFTPAEATAIGMAGELGRAGALSAFTRSGWTKIAAAGARRTLGDTPVAHTSFNDTTRLSPQFLTTILQAVARRRRITFTYLADPKAEPATRTMDPWGLVPIDGHVYLVGYDIDRNAPRSFRAVRVSDVAYAGDASHPPVADLQEIVRGSLTARKELVDAVLTVAGNRGGELGEPVDGRLTLTGVDADWLVRTAASYAPDVVVESPPEIRSRVVALLKEAI